MILKLILGVYVAATALLLGYDAWTALVERYSHFHMGRWADHTTWQQAVRRVCLRWAKRTPTLRL